MPPDDTPHNLMVFGSTRKIVATVGRELTEYFGTRIVSTEQPRRVGLGDEAYRQNFNFVQRGEGALSDVSRIASEIEIYLALRFPQRLTVRSFSKMTSDRNSPDGQKPHIFSEHCIIG